jgi:hypothetical protein
MSGANASPIGRSNRTMTATSSQRNRRALVLLGVAVIAYLTTSQLLLPLYDQVRAAPVVAAEKTQQLRKYKRELSHRGNYDALQTITRMKLQELQGHFFSNDSAGSAELQKLVEDSAKQASITLSQRTATQAKKLDELVTEISMTASFESTPNQLVAFMSQLQSSPKVANVRVAQIDPVQVAYEAPKQGELKKSLRVNLTIAGEALAPVNEAKGK